MQSIIKRLWLVNWPACKPDLTSIKNIWSTRKQKYNKGVVKLLKVTKGK